MIASDLLPLLAGLPVAAVAIGANPDKDATGPYTTCQSADGLTVGIDWAQTPTDAQTEQAAAIITAVNIALLTAQEAAAEAFQAQADTAVAALYVPNMTTLLNSLYAQAIALGYANRAAYLVPLVTWGNGLAEALEAAVAAIEAATTVDAVQAVALMLPAAPSPAPTRAGAMAISN
jgi:hypothetical protein